MLKLPSVDKEAMMTRQQVAAYLGVSTRTVDRMIACGELRARHVHKRLVRIYRSSVEKEAG